MRLEGIWNRFWDKAGFGDCVGLLLCFEKQSDDRRHGCWLSYSAKKDYLLPVNGKSIDFVGSYCAKKRKAESCRQMAIRRANGNKAILDPDTTTPNTDEGMSSSN